MLRIILIAAAVALGFSVEQSAQRAGVIPFSVDPVPLDDRVTDYEHTDWRQPFRARTSVPGARD